MIRRLMFFFESSIRNKLTVGLPLVIAFVVLFLFTISLLTLRQSVFNHVISEFKNRFQFLTAYLDDTDLDFKQRELLFKGMSYVQTFDGEGTVHLQRGDLSDYQFQHNRIDKIIEKTPQEMTIRDVTIDGRRFIELDQWVNKKRLVAGFSLAPARHLLLVQTFILFGIALATVFSCYAVIVALGHLFSDPLCKLTEEAGKMAFNGVCVKPLSLAYRKDEVGKLASELNGLMVKIGRQQNELAENKAKIELGHVATQVAHDIRGPLSSMQTALGFFGEMKMEDKKFNDVMNLLQLSSKRLTGIADGLLKKHTGNEEQAVIFSLHKILDELIGEYHSQHKAITFTKKYPSRSVELHGDPTKLQRVFGNIIKNAAEAMEYKGTVTIKTEIKEDAAVISIADTGPGMSSETLERVLGGGYTEGKRDGYGIGMTVVRETVKENGGNLTATSEIGKGTTFFISLPLPDKEKTVIEEITLHVQESEPLIIIDDDPSLREQWRMVLEEKGKQALLCESYEDFQNQKITTNISQTAVVDYHFDNSEKTGADILRLLKQQGFTNLYLCTAEYWKPSVQKLAEDLNVTLCPKPLPRIEIKTMDHGPLTMDQQRKTKEVKQSPVGTKGDCFVATAPRNDKESCHDKKSGYTVLVIDDDEGVRMSWEMMQAKLGIADLHCYPNMEEMQSNGVDLDAVDIAFVDKNIEGSAFSGAAVLLFLKEKCAGKLVLASGENEKELRKNPQFNNADFITQDKVPSSLSKFLN